MIVFMANIIRISKIYHVLKIMKFCWKFNFRLKRMGQIWILGQLYIYYGVITWIITTKLIKLNLISTFFGKNLWKKPFFSEWNCELGTVLCGFMIVKPALATQGFKEATCIVEETISLGKRECKCGGFSNDDPYCESRNVIWKLFSQKSFFAWSESEIFQNSSPVNFKILKQKILEWFNAPIYVLFWKTFRQLGLFWIGLYFDINSELYRNWILPDHFIIFECSFQLFWKPRFTIKKPKNKPVFTRSKQFKTTKKDFFVSKSE